MTREILFRGKFNNEFYSCLSQPYYPQDKFIYGDLLDMGKGRFAIKHKGDNRDLGTYVIPETVGQFIGFNDKNGVKIFDGDRVKVFLYDGTVEIHTIVWKASNYKFTLSGLWAFDDTLRCEVIGNIHDNKLEVQDE